MKTTGLWVALAAVTAAAAAGPVEFGRAELQKAVAERGLQPMAVVTEVTGGPAESYRVEAGKVTGGDERGVMYGLLEAAEQVRRTGRIAPAEGKPATAMRGIRMLLHNKDIEEDWYYSRDHWDKFFEMMARNRFNRFNLVFAHQTHYLAPPYPFWLEVPEFPEIRAKGVTAAERQRNLDTLRYITETAAAHGVDFTLGLWQHDIQKYRRPPMVMVSMVEGLTPENIGPYSYAALKKILQLCPAIKSIQLRTNRESGIMEEQQLEFYRDWIFRAVKEAGRPVLLDIRGWTMRPGLLEAAIDTKLPVRLSAKYWAEDMGRPYQPAETYPRYSYLNFLKKSRPLDFYWEIWTLGSHRLMLWGDPEYVRRTARTFDLGRGIGFEIDAPLSQKGYWNRPGKWGILAAGQKERTFWNWEFERYWMFYRVWGRLTYDPAAPDAVWMDEMRRRFGAAAEDAAQAYRHASDVVTEIVAAHLADPNMYIWPEINPGGLVSTYKDVLPSDWRYIARMREAVRTRLDGQASAKQSPLDTAALFDGIAERIEQAVAAAGRKAAPGNAEWKGTETDFRVLAGMARYHARKQRAAYYLTWFYETGDPAAVAASKKEALAGLEIWKGLVKLTDGVYPDVMVYGPNDVGHWKHKLPYVEHDVAWLDELGRNLERYGAAEHRFDFGGPPAEGSDEPYRTYRDGPFIRHNHVEPRYQEAHPGSRYTEAAGFGWVSDGPRSAVAVTPAPYLEAAAVAQNPQNLPRSVLLRDYVEGTGPQVFRVRTGDGTFEARVVKPDGSVTRSTLKAANGAVDVAFPEGKWQVSALLVAKAGGGAAPMASMAPPKALARPRIVHTAARSARVGQPLQLAVNAQPAANVTGIRLHYRALNQEEEFRTLESKGASATFTIPGADIGGEYDLMYYFEVLNTERTGWFQPDPAVETPYYVVRVER